MSRWSLRVQEEGGTAHVTILDGQMTIGVVSMAWHEYAALCRVMLKFIKATSQVAVEKHLGDAIWSDAQATFDNSPELAKIKLAEFGWTSEKIKRYSELIGGKIAEAFVDFLPESGP